MNMSMTVDARQLDELAATQIITDTELAGCWSLVREGIQTGVIGLGNLPELLDHLRAGNGMTWDELSIEVLEDDPDRALVSILDDEHTCGAPLLIAALDQLRARAEGWKGRRGTQESPSLPDCGAAGPGAAPPTATAAAVEAPDLLTALAEFLGTSSARLAGDPGEYRAQVERVRAAAAAFAQAVNDPAGDAVARAAASAKLQEILAGSAQAAASSAQARIADLPRTMAELGIDTSRFAPALRSIAAWIEAPDAANGAAVDRTMAEFDAALGIWVDVQPRAAEATDRNERVRESARAAIAARLGKPKHPR